MSSSTEGWQELNLPSRTNCPKLFFSFKTGEETFTLFLTDLIAIWQCSLDRHAIVTEASRQHTSIDPSESSAQLKVLISKFGQSLVEGTNVLTQSRDKNTNSLLLHTELVLPRPLRPLNWAFKLAPQNSAVFAEQILRPCLHEVAVSQEKIESLLRVIKEKDHVLSRLLDKIGSSAFDLTLIFPGITGLASRKGGQVPVEEAKKHVPGIASFNEQAWQTQFVGYDDYKDFDTSGLRQLVRGCEKCFTHTREEHEAWINDLPSKAAMSDHRVVHAPSPLAQCPTSPVEEGLSGEAPDSEDDFEIQTTPSPKRTQKNPEKSKAPPQNAPPIGSDASDQGTESQSSAPQPKQTRRVGRLGRRTPTKSSSEKNSKRMPASPASQPENDAPASASTSASDSEPDLDGPSQAVRSTTTGSKRKLGGLGRKRPTQISRAESSSPPPANRGTGHSKTSSRLTSRDSDMTDLSAPQTETPTCSPGRRRGKTTTDSPEPAMTRAATAAIDTPSRRLGRLGGRKAQASSPTPASASKQTRKAKPKPARPDDADADSDTTASTSTPIQSPPPEASREFATNAQAVSPPPQTDGGHKSPKSEPEETEDRKVERRRAELKRTLITGQGGRKKRRF